MKRTIAFAAGLVALDMLLRLASLALVGELPLARIGTTSAWLVHNLHRTAWQVSPMGIAAVALLVVSMIALAEVSRSAAFRLPLALFLSGAVTNASHVLTAGIVANPLYITSADGWIAFNLADVTVYLGLAWYGIVCLPLFWKEFIHAKQHASRSGHDVRRGLRSVRRQPDHSL